MAIKLYGKSVVNRPLYKITKPTPLIGLEFIGLIDRASNLIEVKPITGCMLDCVYCWVSESKQENDFIVSKHYLISEFKKLASLRENPVQAYITAHGDVLLYPELPELAKGLKKTAKTVSMSCHVQNLDYNVIDKLSNSVDRLNITIDTLKQERVLSIYNRSINLKQKLDVIRYASENMHVIITPVIMPYINKDEALSFVSWVKRNIPYRGKPRILFQKYIPYKDGKKLRSESFKSFREWVTVLQKKEHEPMVLDFKQFGIVKDRNSENVFRYGETINGKILSYGRNHKQWIAESKHRLLLCYKDGKHYKHPRIGSIAKLRVVYAFNNIYKAVIEG